MSSPQRGVNAKMLLDGLLLNKTWKIEYGPTIISYALWDSRREWILSVQTQRNKFLYLFNLRRVPLSLSQLFTVVKHFKPSILSPEGGQRWGRGGRRGGFMRIFMRGLTPMGLRASIDRRVVTTAVQTDFVFVSRSSFIVWYKKASCNIKGK